MPGMRALSDGVVRAARVALGGVATRPWREKPVEAALIGRPAGEQVFREAAALAARAQVITVPGATQAPLPLEPE